MKFVQRINCRDETLSWNHPKYLSYTWSRSCMFSWNWTFRGTWSFCWILKIARADIFFGL